MFTFNRLHEPVWPLMFRLLPRYNYVLINEYTRFSQTLKAIQNTWRKFDNRLVSNSLFCPTILTNNIF